ncbi:MAG: glycosyltransferase [Gemmatimonadaceae bacterium]|nr:glycosyltransferase [Gemmatimonadaceae bacterium]
MMVANFPPDVGYAWWLMEAFWISIAEAERENYDSILAYPSKGIVPTAVLSSPLTIAYVDFTSTHPRAVLHQIGFIRANNVRVLYLTDQPAISLKYLAYKLAGVRRIIVHDHAPGDRSVPPWAKGLLKAIVARLPLVSADALFGTSAFTTKRHQLVYRYPARRLYTVANGIPAAPIANPTDTYSAFRIPRDRLVVVSASRAHRVKRIDAILYAIAELIHTARRTDLHFLHLGDGPELESLLQLAETLSISEYVTFAGRVNEPSQYFPSCSVGLHLSSAEVGYSLSTLEMMRGRLPMIVADDRSVCGATIDGETGFLVPASDPVSVSKAIATLLDSEELRRSMGLAGYRLQQSTFTISSTLCSLTRAVHQVISSQPVAR